MYLASFPSWLLRLFRQGTTEKQRFSRLFWMYRMCRAVSMSACARTTRKPLKRLRQHFACYHRPEGPVLIRAEDNSLTAAQSHARLSLLERRT